jgi:hypothetical protein
VFKGKFFKTFELSILLLCSFTITSFAQIETNPYVLSNSAWSMCGQNISHNGRDIADYAASSTFKWKYQTGGDVLSSPSIEIFRTIYFGPDDSKFYALNYVGTLKWK